MAERRKPGGWHDADDSLANERILVTMTSSPEPGRSNGVESEDDPKLTPDEESTEEVPEPVEAFADDKLAFQANPEAY